MINFEVEVERLPSDDQLRAALVQLFHCNPNDISVVHEDFDSSEKPIACVVFKRHGGQFSAMLSVYTEKPFTTVLECRSLLEKGAALAKLLQTQVVVSNDDSADPYSMIVIDSMGEATIVDVSDDALDEGDNIEIRRRGPSGPILRLARTDLVTMLLENRICQQADIIGVSESEVAAVEETIGSHLPWQFREFLAAIGRGAGSYLHAESGFFVGCGATAELLQRIAVDQPDLQPLTDALQHGRGVFPLSVSANSFRFFKLDAAQDPVIHEWTSGMNWPRPTWPTLSGFLVASARRFLLTQAATDSAPNVGG